MSAVWSLRASYVVPVLFAAAACGPCPDGMQPVEGTCGCMDGTELDSSECDLCEGAEPVSLEQLDEELIGVRGSLHPQCKREVTFRVGQTAEVIANLESDDGRLSGVIESADGTQVGTVSASADADGQLRPVLERGDYVLVLSTQGQTRYDLTLRAEDFTEAEPAPEPGGEKSSAHDLGVVPSDEASVLGGYVGPTDDEDLVRLEVEQNSMLTLGVREVSARVVLHMLPDAAILERDAPLTMLDVRSPDDGLVSLAAERGTYFISLTPGAASYYELRASVEPYLAEPEQDPGEDWEDALDIGALGTSRVDFGGYVGRTDALDFYRFDIEQNATLTYTVDDVEGRVLAQLYEDAVQINRADPLRQLDVRAADGGAQTGSLDLAAGTYFFVITPTGNALYTLSLSIE
ncbi:MAG: hypothetical protein OXT09_04885 [Myxococcales bacterium]|nr:hypothetical protein [Myxococcales bacterium]